MIAVFSAIASGLMILMLMLLPETRGRDLASLEQQAAPADIGGTAPVLGRGHGGS